MFIRETIKKDKNTKKIYYSYQLVESYRTDRGPRQRILLTIGHNGSLTKTDRKLLANRIEELATNVQTLFDYPDYIESLARSFTRQLIKKKSVINGDRSNVEEQIQTNEPDFETIDLNSVEHNNCRTAGLEHVSLETIRKLEVDKKLRKLGFTKREVEVAIGSIIGRLVNPRSEHATHFWLKNNTALDELLGCDFSRLSLDQLYQISDKLLGNKIKIEKHLATVEENLFSLDNTIVLYDLTNTYFEGTACCSEKAKRGRSKEKRNDCPLVCLGLVLNQEGFPLSSSIYEGNISEPSTLEDIVNELKESSKSTSPPTIVLDAGIATEENLKWLRGQKQPYVVCSRNKFEPPKDLEKNYDFIREKKNNIVKASLVKKEDDSGEFELFCHSTTREQKESAIKSLFQLRFEEELKKLNNGLSKKGCTKKYDKVLEKIGRLKEKYSRVSRFYEIGVDKANEGPNAIRVSYTCNTQSITDQYSGFYCLRCWGLDWDAEKLWMTYVMLTKVEEGFRCLKSELGLRPIFHKFDHRIDGHLFITLLAYHIMQSVIYQLGLKGIHVRWQTLKDIMASQTRVTSTFQNNKGQTIHVRSSTQAEPLQKEIYDALNITLRPGRRVKSIV